MLRYTTFICLLLALVAFSCKKETNAPDADPEWRYFEVGIREWNTTQWRDSSYIVATKNPTVLQKIEAQLALPVADRKKIVAGKLAEGNGGYNKNAGHHFKWRIKEDDWDLVDLTIELSDGRPYTDVDQNLDYWLNNVKRFTPWGSYIKREIAK